MTLIDGERKLANCGDEVILTTHRLFEERNYGDSITSIMLPEVCSCVIARRVHPIWLRLAALSVFCGVSLSIFLYKTKPGEPSDFAWEIGVGTAVCFLLIFGLTAFRRLEISSAKAVITIARAGSNIVEFTDFINSIDAAKAQWYSGSQLQPRSRNALGLDVG